MPTSKLTRVRVDCFSKIIASILCVSSSVRSPRLVRAFNSLATTSMPRSWSSVKSSSVRKCRGVLISSPLSRHVFAGGLAVDGGKGRGKLVDRLLDVVLGDDKRRQQAQNVLAGSLRQQLVIVPQARHE